VPWLRKKAWIPTGSLPAAVAIGVAARRRTWKAQLISSLAVGGLIGVPAIDVLLGLVGLAAGVK
jgi:hypothetical protein